MLFKGIFLDFNRNSADHSYFTAVIIERNSLTLLIEVTDTGNSGISPGQRVRISADSCPDMVTGDSIYIDFDGSVKETYPLQLGRVYSITRPEEAGDAVNG